MTCLLTRLDSSVHPSLVIFEITLHESRKLPCIKISTKRNDLRHLPFYFFKPEHNITFFVDPPQFSQYQPLRRCIFSLEAIRIGGWKTLGSMVFQTETGLEISPWVRGEVFPKNVLRFHFNTCRFCNKCNLRILKEDTVEPYIVKLNTKQQTAQNTATHATFLWKLVLIFKFPISICIQ